MGRASEIGWPKVLRVSQQVNEIFLDRGKTAFRNTTITGSLGKGTHGSLLVTLTAAKVFGFRALTLKKGARLSLVFGRQAGMACCEWKDGQKGSSPVFSNKMCKQCVIALPSRT